MAADNDSTQFKTDAALGKFLFDLSKPESIADVRLALDSGMTEDEAICWWLSGMLAMRAIALPVEHPADAREICQAIHVIQDKLLARPTYRLMYGDPDGIAPDGVIRA